MPRDTTSKSSAVKPYDRPAWTTSTPKKNKARERESSPLTPLTPLNPSRVLHSDSEDEYDAKPFVKPEPETPTKPKSKAKAKASSTKAPGRTWTGPELVALFDIAAQGVKRTDYEGKLEGRTALQCLKTWQNTILPFIKKALTEKGEGKR